jgi:hypothetical protein
MAGRNGGRIPACVWTFLGVLIVGLLRRDPLPAVGAIVFFVALGLLVHVLERRFPVLRRPVPGHVHLRIGRRRFAAPVGAALIIALVCGLVWLTWWLLYGQ